MNLVAQIEILNAKLSMSSAFGAVHALGGQVRVAAGGSCGLRWERGAGRACMG